MREAEGCDESPWRNRRSDNSQNVDTFGYMHMHYLAIHDARVRLPTKFPSTVE